ncbi:MAG TPA: 6,7-dimethyl-8-ribityllumazine synthase [Chthoniobacterales bacterium]|jgi:6,7-dimethyl-8-ribityllumazine synthase|nr:6,7-dimethyl-8-ribityllumazine synthase [Chthoniobacterales bacterium]
MSNLISPRPRIVGGPKRHFPIVASQFNAAYVQGLIDHATAELRALLPGATTSLLQVPGAFEIPLVVREIAMQKRADAIIAIGVILKGETDHADHLGRSVTDALQRIAVTHGIPVINVVLSFDDEDQARARCLENEINRGTEAARAAVEIANVISKLRNNK